MHQERTSRRLHVVDEHIRRENQHDLPAVLETFGRRASYDDEAWSEHYEGLDGVRAYYENLMRAVPDLHIEVRDRLVADDAIVVQAVISGTHGGSWRGLPGTGRQVQFPLCAIYTFDEDDALLGERIYYDRATVLRQLGVFHEPESVAGRCLTVLTHPFTFIRMAIRKIVEGRES